MEVRWEYTKYGWELLEEYSDNQVALLKIDEKENEYFISCLDQHDIGREYLETSDSNKAKRRTIQRVVDERANQIQDIRNQIEELQKLL